MAALSPVGSPKTASEESSIEHKLAQKVAATLTLINHNLQREQSSPLPPNEIQDLLCHLEETAVELSLLEKELTVAMARQVEVQRGPMVEALRKEQEDISSRLIQGMQSRFMEEKKLKVQINDLFHQKVASKNTLHTLSTLGMKDRERTMTSREKAGLKHLREKHKEAVKLLQRLGHQRKYMNDESIKAGTVLMELRKDFLQRDYCLIRFTLSDYDTNHILLQKQDGSSTSGKVKVTRVRNSSGTGQLGARANPRGKAGEEGGSKRSNPRGKAGEEGGSKRSNPRGKAGEEGGSKRSNPRVKAGGGEERNRRREQHAESTAEQYINRLEEGRRGWQQCDQQKRACVEKQRDIRERIAQLVIQYWN